jgi:hypothetical protein
MYGTREKWAALVASFERTSQPAGRFCESRGINPRTFAWWRWQLRNAARQRHGDHAVKLLPVHVAEGHDGQTGRVVLTVAGLELRFDTSVDLEYVVALVTRLRGA